MVPPLRSLRRLLLIPALLLTPTQDAEAIALNMIGRDIGGGPPSAWIVAQTYLPYFLGMGPNTRLSGIELLATMLRNAVLWVIGGVAVCAILYGAILIITSTGNTEKITAGKKAVQYGLLGLFLALIANGISAFLFCTLRLAGGGAC
jgi:hypothetical protein